MSSLNTKQMLDTLIKEVKANEKFTPTKDNMYRLGVKIRNQVPKIFEIRKANGKDFTYVSWKWYEYILTKFDNDYWWWLSDYSDNYEISETTITWLGKNYVASYGIEPSPFKIDYTTNKKTGEQVDNKGEKLINENMRCLAKLCSRATGLFWDLWIEGSNK